MQNKICEPKIFYPPHPSTQPSPRKRVAPMAELRQRTAAIPAGNTGADAGADADAAHSQDDDDVAENKKKTRAAAHPAATSTSTAALTTLQTVWRRGKLVAKGLLYTIVAIAFFGAFMHTFFHEDTQLFLMRFFRNLSRAKTRARLYGDNNALVAVMAGYEDQLEIPDDDDDGMRFTLEDLASFDGVAGSPIYLAIMGRVYDVTAGAAFYGPQRSYHHYAGKDATRSFATGCTKAECLVGSLVGLSQDQKREAHRWLELYQFHDKYKFLGKVVAGNVDDLVEQAMLEDDALSAAREAEAELLGDDGKAAGFDVMRERGVAFYREQKHDDALVYFKTALVMLGEASRTNEVEVVLKRADVMITMAAVAQKQQHYHQAQESYQEALDGMVAALGKPAAGRHTMYGRALADQAASLYMTGKVRQAVVGFEHAVQVYRDAAASGADAIVASGAGRESLARTSIELLNTKLNLAMALGAAAVEHKESGYSLPEREGATDRALSLLDDVVREASADDLQGDRRAERILLSAKGQQSARA